MKAHGLIFCTSKNVLLEKYESCGLCSTLTSHDQSLDYALSVQVLLLKAGSEESRIMIGGGLPQVTTSISVKMNISNLHGIVMCQLVHATNKTGSSLHDWIY
jgi:hypothetical protein